MYPSLRTQPFIFWILLFLCQNRSFCQTQTSSSSYKIRHTSAARFFESRKYLHTRDNATVIVGKWGTTQDGADLLLMKVNERGETLWSKRVPLALRLDEYELVEMSDGSLVFVGNSQHNPAPIRSDMLLIKFSCQGEGLWSRNLSMIASVYHLFLTPYSIKEGKNNDVIISFYGTGASLQYSVICRVNSLGNLVWSKTFYGVDGQTQLPSVALFSNDKIVVFGFNSLYQNSFLYNKSFFAMQLDYNTGSTLDLKGYSYSEVITNYGVLVTHPKIHFYAEQLTNGGFALFGVFSNFNQLNAYYFKLVLRADLTIHRTATFSVPLEIGKNWSKIKVFPNGQTHIVSAVYDAQRFYWYLADSLQNKIREQKTIYPNTYIDLRYAVSQSGPSRSLHVLSTRDVSGAGNGSIEMVQVEDNDPRILSCLGVDTAFTQVLPWSVFSGTMQWRSVGDNEALLTPLQFTSAPIAVTSQFVCEPLPSGSSAGTASIKIMGNDTVCSSSLTQQYVARRVNQSAPVQWVLDSVQNGSLTVLNDSTVSVTFASPGVQPKRVMLYAYAGACTVTKDSLEILLLPPNQKLSANISACELPLTLHPGWWFTSYQWQDGSTDSTYRVTRPGVYTVILTDACGTVLKDSLTVHAAGSLDIGPDRIKCNNDTLHLTAPRDFFNYQWSNNYNISSLTTSSVVVNPRLDTAYYLKAEIRPGCYAYDTIRITVQTSPPILLGADKGFCSSDSAVLDAGSGFSSYRWNNAATSQMITVKANGVYSVIGFTQKGCRSYDTLQILQVSPLPVVRLDKDNGICSGSVKTFDAGNFASYLWQDGSTGRTFTTGSPGNYHVSVVDNNGCKGSDSAVITDLHTLPQGFLKDTSVCEGGKVELRPIGEFKSYLWSTGNHSAFITITQPGKYVLEVEDNKNCRGVDSAVIHSKSCVTGFYVPSAFTPNGDRKNDFFKPLLSGNVKTYRFAIYNRWGELVFRTSELQKGWDGKIAGKLQPTGVFVWTCVYQLEGGELKQEKGAVLLIK